MVDLPTCLGIHDLCVKLRSEVKHTYTHVQFNCSCPMLSMPDFHHFYPASGSLSRTAILRNLAAPARKPGAFLQLESLFEVIVSGTDAFHSRQTYLSCFAKPK